MLLTVIIIDNILEKVQVIDIVKIKVKINL